MDNTYWNNNGTYETACRVLEAYIPDEGSAVAARKNPKLEVFRKASNCYYDLFNNGLCNRAAEFNRVFKIRKSAVVDFDGKIKGRALHMLEQRMDKIILEAAMEQGLGLLTVTTL